MLTYTKLKGNPRKFLALTGLTPKEFQLLIPAFRHAYARRFPRHLTSQGTPRRRKLGGGRKGALASPEQKLLFALVYQKDYPVQDLMGELFELSQSRTNAWIHQLLPLLRDALDDLGMLPERDPKQFSRHERKQREPHDLIIDGTERRRQRPKNKEKQKLHYSGRKKMHSDKNVLIANRKTKRIGFLSQTYPGKTQDKKVVDGEPIRFPRDATLYQDTGFQGYAPRVRESYQPKKSRARRNCSPRRNDATDESRGFACASNTPLLE